MDPKVAVILYKSKVLKNGEHPIMVRVNKKGRKYVSLGISCPANLWDFEKNMPKRTHPNKKFIQELIKHKKLAYDNKLLKDPQIGTSAEKIIEEVENERVYKQFFPFLDELIDRLVQSGSGNADVYKETRRKLKNFKPNSMLLLTDIDQRFLNKYEAYLRGLEMKETSISIYFRTLRAVINSAIKEKLLKEDDYPFKEFKVSKFNTTTQKRAITKEEMKKVEALPIPPESPFYIPKQYFLFSYYGQGMNFRDMALLKWKNVIDDRVFYKRTKTRKFLQFKLLPPAQAIIDFYRPQTPYDGEDYVFPILDKHVHITPTQIKDRSKKVRRQVNKAVKELAKMAGISGNITTYVARHTYATVLKRSGIDTSVISEAMGHANSDTTKIYLKSFANEVIDKANEHLL